MVSQSILQNDDLPEPELPRHTTKEFAMGINFDKLNINIFSK